MPTSLGCELAAQVQVSDGLRTQAAQSESSYGTGSHVPALSTADPSVSAWVQQCSVSPNASISYDAPGESLVPSLSESELLLMLSSHLFFGTTYLWASGFSSGINTYMCVRQWGDSSKTCLLYVGFLKI